MVGALVRTLESEAIFSQHLSFCSALSTQKLSLWLWHNAVGVANLLKIKGMQQMESAALQLGAAAVQKQDPPPYRVAAIDRKSVV